MSECRVGIPEPTWERATLECHVPVLGARPVTKAAWPEPEQSLPVLAAPKRCLWGDHASPSPSCRATAPEARTPCGAAERTQGSGSSCSRRAARLLYSGKASPETWLSPDQQTVRRQVSTGRAGIPFNNNRTSTGDCGSGATASPQRSGEPVFAGRPRGRPGKVGAAPMRLEIGGVAPAREDVSLAPTTHFLGCLSG